MLFVADFAYSSSSLILSGVVSRLSSCSDVVLVVRGAHPADADWEYGLETGIDGVVSCLGAGDARAKLFVRGRRGPPVALVSANQAAPSARKRTVSFVCDAAAVGRAAAELLMRRGLSSFGYVGARAGVPFSWDVARRDAFIGALSENGLPATVYAPAPAEAGAEADTEALAAWLKALPKPSGLFVSYDVRAMSILAVCHAAGIAVPEQIQVVGVDNEPWICEKTSPTLTSIEPDFEGAGYRAAEAVLAMMDGAAGGAAETFGVRRVVQRMSTMDAHGHTRRAIRVRDYIAAHALERLSVSSLAKLLNCSPRTLQIGYRKVFGTTVTDEIADAKVAEAKRLLSSDTPVEAIPELVGYESPRHFKRIFKARTGQTMSQFRQSGRAFRAKPAPTAAKMRPDIN